MNVLDVHELPSVDRALVALDQGQVYRRLSCVAAITGRGGDHHGVRPLSEGTSVPEARVKERRCIRCATRVLVNTLLFYTCNNFGRPLHGGSPEPFFGYQCTGESQGKSEGKSGRVGGGTGTCEGPGDGRGGTRRERTGLSRLNVQWPGTVEGPGGQVDDRTRHFD